MIFTCRYLLGTLLITGNIGGQLGLFIGCSFLTALEFLECILMSSLYHCKRSTVGKSKKTWDTGQAANAESEDNGGNKLKDNSLNNNELYTVTEPSLS